MFGEPFIYCKWNVSGPRSHGGTLYLCDYNRTFAGCRAKQGQMDDGCLANHLEIVNGTYRAHALTAGHFICVIIIELMQGVEQSKARWMTDVWRTIYIL